MSMIKGVALGVLSGATFVSGMALALTTHVVAGSFNPTVGKAGGHHVKEGTLKATKFVWDEAIKEWNA